MALTTQQQQLDEARAAYHALMTGTKASVVVDQNGERVEFARVDLSRLLQYINELQATLSPAPQYGPLRPYF